MSASQTKLGIELSSTGLFIFDLEDPTSRIQVDQVVFDATRVSGLKAEGYIVSVHGVPQDIAQVLPAKVLRDLGVGNHFSAYSSRARQGCRRYRADPAVGRFVNVVAP